MEFTIDEMTVCGELANDSRKVVIKSEKTLTIGIVTHVNAEQYVSQN